MTELIPSVYADTSVFGGVFDEEFGAASRMLFDAIRAGAFRLVTSEIVREEIAQGPQAVRDLFQEMVRDAAIAPVTADALRLREAYQEARILAPQWKEDALHVALATIAHCDMILSWNFKHIVHYRKIPLYNAVNTLEGFGSLRIYSPLEVVGYGNQDKDV